MKFKRLTSGSLLAVVLLSGFSSGLLSGCASVVPVGILYTNIDLPMETTANGVNTKVGVATCQSYLALVATGDCSVAAAKKNGEITEVTHMDWSTESILGIIGHYKLTVYGN